MLLVQFVSGRPSQMNLLFKMWTVTKVECSAFKCPVFKYEPICPFASLILQKRICILRLNRIM